MNASITDNRSLLAKADLALSDLTSDAGILVPEQAQRFIRILIKEAVMMKLATVVPMRAPQQRLEKIKFGSRVLRAGQEAQALAAGDRVKPDLSKVELNAKLFKAEVRLDNEVLEDSIERAQLRQTIMTLMGEAVSRDMDEVIIQGDTASSDLFLAQFDGLLKQVTSNTYAHGTNPIDKTVFHSMIKALPIEFHRNRRDLRFLTSVNAEIDYRDSLSERATVVGDKFLEQDAPVMYAGIPIQAVPMFPENLGSGTDETDVILMDPKNLHVGIWREIRVETDKLVSEGVVLVVATMRFDVKLAHEPATVKATGIQV